MSEPERPPLRAVPALPGDGLELAQSPSPAVYADVTSPGERKAVLPSWLASCEAFAEHSRRVRGWLWFEARFHGLRAVPYLAVAVFWAVIGVFRLGGRWLRWWLFPVPLEVYADAVAGGHRAWHRTHAVHRQTTKVRAVVSLMVLAAVAGASVAAWLLAPWWVWLLAAPGALVLLAWQGRPAGVRIVQPAHVPPEYEVLTRDVIARALASLGIAGINQFFREGRDASALFPSPVREDGPGWRAEIDLPFGVTATMVIERREQLASGLRRPLGAVWPEPVTDEHSGRLELWVGRQDVSRAKAPPWPLAKAGQADVFRPFPFAVDVRGRAVKVPLAYHNWLAGSIPGQGKTAAVRVLACGVALDPLAEMWVHELKGTGDLDALQPVCHRFVSGIDDGSIEYAAESLRLLRAEVERRAPRIKALDPRLCPEKRVTREIAARRSLRLWPVVCIVDECQNLFGHPKFGKQAGADAEFIIKIGRALGVILVLATQRPDKASLPTGVSANVSVRFCLKMMGQWENDAVLGTSSYKNGIRATTFRPKIDAGLGYLIGEDPAQVCRTYFLDVPAAKAVVARARVARERAGTLSGVALGEDGAGAVREPLSDALAVFNGEPGLHWAVLAERLAAQFPDRWADATADAMSAQLRDLGVPSVTVKVAGQVARGCRKDAVEEAAAGRYPPGPGGGG